jgi:hypothetical protein
MNHGSWRPVDSIMIVTCRKPVRNNTEKRLKHPVARFSRCIIEFSAGAQPASLLDLAIVYSVRLTLFP